MNHDRAIYIEELKQGKANIRVIDLDQIQQTLVEVKQIGGKDKRTFTLTLNNGTVYTIPDDANLLTRETHPDFLELLSRIAKILPA